MFEQDKLQYPVDVILRIIREPTQLMARKLLSAIPTMAYLTNHLTTSEEEIAIFDRLFLQCFVAEYSKDITMLIRQMNKSVRLYAIHGKSYETLLILLYTIATIMTYIVYNKRAKLQEEKEEPNVITKLFKKMNIIINDLNGLVNGVFRNRELLIDYFRYGNTSTYALYENRCLIIDIETPDTNDSALNELFLHLLNNHTNNNNKRIIIDEVLYRSLDLKHKVNIDLNIFNTINSLCNCFSNSIGELPACDIRLSILKNEEMCKNILRSVPGDNTVIFSLCSSPIELYDEELLCSDMKVIN